MVNLPANYESKLRSRLSKLEAAQQLDGAIVNLSVGRAFRFDRAIHSKPTQLDPARPIFLSMDQNVSPMCGVVGQYDRQKGTMTVLDEIYLANDATTMRAANQFFTKWGPAVIKHNLTVLTWCDSASDARNTQGADTDAIILNRELKRLMPGIKIIDANDRKRRRVQEGVNSLNALLEPAEGPPKIVVDPKCRELIADLETVAWIEGQSKLDKSDPRRSHACDSLRYVSVQELPITRNGIIKLCSL